MTTLSEQEASNESKRKMLEMLRKLEEEDREANGDFVTDDLEERLGEIDLNAIDAKDIWSAMTEKEQKQFEAAVETGHIYEMIDIWIPWWTPRYDTQNRLVLKLLPVIFFQGRGSGEMWSFSTIFPLPHYNRVMYRSNRSFNIPPGQPPGHLPFLKMIDQIPPNPGQNAVQMPHARVHSGDQMPPPWGHFTGT